MGYQESLVMVEGAGHLSMVLKAVSEGINIQHFEKNGIYPKGIMTLKRDSKHLVKGSKFIYFSGERYAQRDLNRMFGDAAKSLNHATTPIFFFEDVIADLGFDPENDNPDISSLFDYTPLDSALMQMESKNQQDKTKMEDSNMDIKANMEIVNSESLVAVGSIVIDSLLTIHNVKAVMKKDGDGSDWFVSLPQSKHLDEWRDIVSANPQLQNKIKEAVFQDIKRQVIETDQDLPFKVRIHNVDSGATRAKVTVIYQDVITIKGIRVVKGANGMFVSFPQEKLRYGEKDYYKDFISIPDNMKKAVERKIMAEYEKQQNQSKQIPVSR